jgi:AraC family transcriptional regulator
MGDASRAPLTLGSVQSSGLELETLSVSTVRFAPGVSLPRHEHERPSLGVTLEGTYDAVFDGQRYGCVAGSIDTQPAGRIHTNRFGPEGARLLVIDFSEERMRPLLGRAEVFPSVKHFRDARIWGCAEKLLGALQLGDALSLEEIATEALRLAAAPHGNVPGPRRERWLRRVEERIRVDFRGPIALEQLAAEAGVHVAHLTRSFRAATGSSIGDFIRGLRLEWAREQLSMGCAPLADVALEAGFSDQSHFTRLFRDRMGVTPARYRKHMAATTG